MSIKSKARSYFRTLRRMKIGLTFSQAAKLGKCFAQNKSDIEIEQSCSKFVETEIFYEEGSKPYPVMIYGNEGNVTKDIVMLEMVIINQEGNDNEGTKRKLGSCE